MVTAHQILSLSDEIVTRFAPQKIILFGSYAYGTPTDDSDVDLLVVKNYRGPEARKEGEIRLALDRTISIDVHVRSSAELHRRLRMEDFFFLEIVEQGLVLYDRINTALGAQGRRRLQRRLHSAPFQKAQPV